MNNSLRPDPIAWVAPLTGALALLASCGAYAVDYLTIAQAQQTMFPQATAFEPLPLDLTPEQVHAIETRAGAGLRAAGLTAWRAKQGDTTLGYVISDAVIGKFQLISYAVAFGPDATIRDIEILAYREAHGAEVRNASWRAQFVGKSAAAPLAVGNDIDNISGATLSCTHLTDGVRRLATLMAVAALHG